MSVEGPVTTTYPENLYEQIVAQTQRAHRLLSAHWEITYRCNEKCTHCYLDVLSPHANVPQELTTAECFRVIDELAALGVLNLTFSGGEILVRRDFFEIAEYARTKRFLLRLFTNGLLITPTIADRIAALHPYAVEVSLYSTKPEIHDRITQRKRSWELTTRALRLLRARGVRTMMKTPLMRENARELHALKTLAQELDAQFRYDITITPKDTGGLSPLQHRLSHDDLVWLFHEELPAETWASRTVSPDQRTCGIAQNALVIDPYGNIFPCVQVRAVGGNVRTQPIEEIWTNSPIWKELGGLQLSELPICHTCELRNLCVRCHGLAQVEDGNLRGPALVNCHEALARRQVLVEKGALPADYPIPAHLQTYAAAMQTTPMPNKIQSANFIPLSELQKYRVESSIPHNV